MKLINDWVRCDGCTEEKPDCVRYEFEINCLTLCGECDDEFVSGLTLERVRRAHI
jgi:hypothetical protein